MPDARVLHLRETTGVAVCGQKLGHTSPINHLAVSGVHFLQVLDQTPEQCCQRCANRSAPWLVAASFGE